MPKGSLILALVLLIPIYAANASEDEYIYAGPSAPFRYHQWIDDKTGMKMIEVQRLPDNAYSHRGYVKSQTAAEVERENEAKTQQKEAVEELAKKNKFESAGENNAYRFYRNPVTNQRMIIDKKTGKVELKD